MDEKTNKNFILVNSIDQIMSGSTRCTTIDPPNCGVLDVPCGVDDIPHCKPTQCDLW